MEHIFFQPNQVCLPDHPSYKLGRGDEQIGDEQIGWTNCRGVDPISDGSLSESLPITDAKLSKNGVPLSSGLKPHIPHEFSWVVPNLLHFQP